MNNETRVATSMSNMEYRSIFQIAKIAELPTHQVRAIMRKFTRLGLVESQLQGFTTYYRLK